MRSRENFMLRQKKGGESHGKLYIGFMLHQKKGEVMENYK